MRIPAGGGMAIRSSDGLTRPAQQNFEAPEPIRNFMDSRLDFPQPAAMRKSYVVASSYRCGSTFFCAGLMRTGVLGAPGEYLNVGEGRMLRDIMMRRLGADTPEDYFAKLLRCRTSRNGVFGMKVHFPHFETALLWYPSMIKVLSPVTYLYLDRRDKLAQAVSMAKATQTGAWSTMDSSAQEVLAYNGSLIARCLREVAQQTIGWRRWFAGQKIKPYIVHYEDLMIDAAAVTRGVTELLSVQDDEPEEVCVPTVEKQSDDVNLEWRNRFQEAVPDWESWFPLPAVQGHNVSRRTPAWQRKQPSGI